MMRAHTPGLVITGALLLAACSTESPLAIRAVGAKHVAQGSADVRISEGVAQLALGDTGLAIESFRRAIAQDPASVPALRGLGGAYDAMGRGDLSRPLYEQALALAPHDTATLNALAVSLIDKGEQQEGAALHDEIASAGMQMHSTGSVTVPLLSARPMAVEHPTPAPTGPRLERLSLNEVAVITLPARFELAPPTPAAHRATIVSRRAALAQAQPPARRPSSFVAVRLLNGARRLGLAAAGRAMLEQRGWRRIAIGDAPRVVAVSRVTYPVGRERAGHRVAAQFGITAQEGSPLQEAILVLLGSNSSLGRASPGRG